jgi:hypothetical protein
MPAMTTRQDTAYDVFISHSSRDKTVADALCAALEQAGTRCWIAPRDIRPGEDWGASIVDGIKHSRAMVLVFSSNTNTSGHIPREVEQAVKQGVTVIPFRIEEVVPKGSLDYNLSSVHWLDALTPPLENHIGRLVDTVTGFLGQAERTVSSSVAATQVPPPAPAPTPPTRRGSLPGWLVPASAVVVVGVATVWGYAFFTGRGQTAPSALPAPAPGVALPSPASSPTSTAVPATLAPPEATPVPSATTTSGPRPAASEPPSPPRVPARAAATASPAAATAATAAPAQDVPSQPPLPIGVNEQAAAPADGARTAELRQLRRRFLQLEGRRDAVFGTIALLAQQQRAAGAGLRRDIVLARQTAEFQLRDAAEALGAQSSEEASQALDQAERQIEILERFVGR